MLLLVRSVLGGRTAAHEEPVIYTSPIELIVLPGKYLQAWIGVVVARVSHEAARLLPGAARGRDLPLVPGGRRGPVAPQLLRIQEPPPAGVLGRPPATRDRSGRPAAGARTIRQLGRACRHRRLRQDDRRHVGE